MRTLVLVALAGLIAGGCAAEEKREPAAGCEGPPQLLLDAPTDGQAVESLQLDVRGRATSCDALSRIQLHVNGAEQRVLRPSGTAFDFTTRISLATGSNEIHVTASDVKGRRVEVVRTVHTGAERPTIVSFTATPEEVRPGGEVELRWSTIGEAPLSVRIEGIGAQPANGTLRLRPERTTSWRLSASNGSGAAQAQAEARVAPELQPLVRVAAPGSVDLFDIAGAEGPFSVSATGGTVELTESNRLRWTFPAEPGAVAVTVGYRGGSFVHTVEVRPIEPLPATYVGMGGQPDPESRDQLFADPDGTLWVLAGAGVMTRDAESGVWTMVNDGVDFYPWRMNRAPDGSLWLYGDAVDGETLRYVLARFDRAARRWDVVDDLPVPPTGQRLVGLVFGPSGEMVTSLTDREGWGRTSWIKRAVDAPWEQLPHSPSGGISLVGPAGDLYGFCSSVCGDHNVFHLAPGASAWTGLGRTVEYPTHLTFDPNGALVVSGAEGVMRRGEDGSWEDMTAGLPELCRVDEGCWVEGIAFDQAGSWFALTEHGIFAREADGPFALHAALPLEEQVAWSLRALTANEAGDLWISGDTGVWHLPAGSTGFVSTTTPGLPGANLRTSAMATGPDGTVALATGHSSVAEIPRHLLFRGPGSEAWIAVGPEERGSGVVSWLHFESDGSLLFALDDRLHRLAPSGTSFEPLTIAGLPEEAELWSIAHTDGGDIVLLLGGGSPFLLEAGATTWTALPVREGLGSVAAAADGSIWATAWNPAGVFRLAPGASDWEAVGALPPVLGDGARFRKVYPDVGGSVWARSDLGLMRLDEGIWRPVGSGACGWYPNVVITDERILCWIQGGIYVLDLEDEVWVPFAGLTPGTFIEAVAEGPEGRLWVAFQQGGVFELREP